MMPPSLPSLKDLQKLAGDAAALRQGRLSGI